MDKKLESTIKKMSIGAIILSVLVIMLVTCAVDDDQPSTPPVANDVASTTTPEPANETVDEPVAVDDSMTNQQRNAVRSAKNYIAMSGFSRNGLIQQLSSEYGDGYSVEDATVAVDSLDIDYNEQAARSAKQYLDMQGFSCDGLTQQLSSDAGDGYTQAQAAHGAKLAGACD